MTKPCTVTGCDQPKKPGHPKWCRECWLSKQPVTVQIEHAMARRKEALEAGEERKRVPEAEWPPGRRWCAGCQSFRRIGHDVAPSASRCRPCSSDASHRARTEKVFGLTRDAYEALLELQGGRCAICRGQPKAKRLAVDHDHLTGAVRGLCCSRCNRELLGALHHSMRVAWAALSYLAAPPAAGEWQAPESMPEPGTIWMLVQGVLEADLGGAFDLNKLVEAARQLKGEDDVRELREERGHRDHHREG